MKSFRSILKPFGGLFSGLRVSLFLLVGLLLLGAGQPQRSQQTQENVRVRQAESTPRADSLAIDLSQGIPQVQESKSLRHKIRSSHRSVQPNRIRVKTRKKAIHSDSKPDWLRWPGYVLAFLVGLGFWFLGLVICGALLGLGLTYLGMLALALLLSILGAGLLSLILVYLTILTTGKSPGDKEFALGFVFIGILFGAPAVLLFAGIFMPFMIQLLIGVGISFGLGVGIFFLMLLLLAMGVGATWGLIFLVREWYYD